MGIWNEIQEQLKELQQLLDERKQLDEIYNQIKTENDRITDPNHS
jgi:DNA repair exonuclease SbcCD ATPase subunit